MEDYRSQFTGHEIDESVRQVRQAGLDNLRHNLGLFSDTGVRPSGREAGDFCYVGTSVDADEYHWNGYAWTLHESHINLIAEVNKIVQEPGDAEDKVMSQKVVTRLLAIISDDLSSHLVRSDNPHAVTKAQVGLGNVDNTSDMDKPVSRAQREAIEMGRDVVRLFATYADLDGTGLADDAQVKVLADETHGGAESVYTWTGAQFVHVGTVGPYYTKGETDALLEGQDVVRHSAQTLTDAQRRQARENIGAAAPAAQVSHGTAAVLDDAVPGVLHVWSGALAELTVTSLAPGGQSVVNEYRFQFATSEAWAQEESPFEDIDGILWNEEPVCGAGCTYEVSILNGVGLFMEIENE